MEYSWDNYYKLISDHSGKSFDLLSRINFIIFGNYSKGLSIDDIKLLRNTISNCSKLKKKKFLNF